MEEESGIVKDEKPYLIFKCSKCEQYMYVKPTQKSKKCLRCGRHYKVSKLDIVDEVKGMSAAVRKVKELQNALLESPNLSGKGGFALASSDSDLQDVEPLKFEENDPIHLEFYKLLKELSKSHRTFPEYMIHLMRQDYNIKKVELKILIRQFTKNGILKSLDHNYYTLL